MRSKLYCEKRIKLFNPIVCQLWGWRSLRNHLKLSVGFRRLVLSSLRLASSSVGWIYKTEYVCAFYVLNRARIDIAACSNYSRFIRTKWVTQHDVKFRLCLVERVKAIRVNDERSDTFFFLETYWTDLQFVLGQNCAKLIAIEGRIEGSFFVEQTYVEWIVTKESLKSYVSKSYIYHTV